VKLPLENPKYRKLARAISSFLAISGLAVWFFHFYVWDQYDRTRPIHPDYLAGRIYGLNNHGHVVYLTKEEHARLTKLTILAFSLFGCGFIIALVFEEGISKWNSRPPAWEKKQF
jgi:hypothetical protein